MASVLKVDKLDPQSGTALEIGTSGDTITVPTGAATSLDGAVTINDTGADVDLRIESDTDTHALFLDGANGRIGMSNDSPKALFHISSSTNDYTSGLLLGSGSGTSEASAIWHENIGNTSLVLSNMYDNAAGQIKFNLREDGTAVTPLTIVADGRGLSQFTALVWILLNGSSFAVTDSFNVASATDNGTGDYTVTYSNNMANATYSSVIDPARGTGDSTVGTNIVTRAVGSIRFETARDDSTKADATNISMAIFGDI
jgi:hypothetical protein